MQLYSFEGRKSGEAFAKLCPEMTSNWIAGHVVRACKLKSIRRDTPKSQRYEGLLLVSTGHLVEFICPGRLCRHRFHVFQDPSFAFDMLYGADFVDGLG